MKKVLLSYLCIFLMFQLGLPAYAEPEQEGCKWEIIEETETYVRDQCIGGGIMSARIRQKNISGVNITVVDNSDSSYSAKDTDPIENTKEGKKVEKEIATIHKEVNKTGDKVTELKEKTVADKVQDKVNENIKKKQLAETPVEETEKPIVKDVLKLKDVDKKSDDALVKKAEDKSWEDLDKDPSAWMRIYQMFPRLLFENEKIKAAELEYEAAKETLKSEYSAYYPQVTVKIGNNWEDDRTPAKGTYPNNTITHDSKQGIQKSITITQMIWDGGRTTAVIDKAKHTTQQAYYRLELVKEDVIMEGINAWINQAKTYNSWQANKKVENNAKITLSMTIEKVKKGESSKLEQLQIEQQYRTYQTLTMTSKLAYDSAVQRFQNVWRFSPHMVEKMPVPIADLLGTLPIQGTEVSNNTALKIADLDIKIAQEQLAFDRAENKPRIDGNLSYTEKDGELAGGYDTDSSRKEEWRADVTLTWKLFGGFKNKHMTSADRVRMQAAVKRYADTLRTTDEQFKNAWNNHVLVEKNLKTLKRTVEINDEMYKLTLADYQAGNSPIMAVFSMKTAHLMSEIAYDNAKLDWLIARYQLHKVLGQVNPLLK